MFAVDPAFETTSTFLLSLTLCQARLQLDRHWPWIVLIPRRIGMAEIEELPARDRRRLVDEIVLAGTAVRAVGNALGAPVEKLNVGALGNITRQLHVHVVGRRGDDAAWPGPVWGFGAAATYADGEVERATAAALAVLEA